MKTKRKPESCDICHDPVVGRFYDAKTQDGPWGDLCRGCFLTYAIGLGTGRGQEYTHNPESDLWEKTAG